MSENQSSDGESDDAIKDLALLNKQESGPDLPDTQPLNYDEGGESGLMLNLRKPWGYLLPDNNLLDSVSLIKVT